MDVFRLIHAIGVHATSRWLQLAIATVCWLALFALISAKQTVAIPGWERLAIRPVSSGAPAGAITIGIVCVASLAAQTGGVSRATMTSTLCRASSSARPRNSSGFPAADRTSIRMFWPST